MQMNNKINEYAARCEKDLEASRNSEQALRSHQERMEQDMESLDDKAGRARSASLEEQVTSLSREVSVEQAERKELSLKLQDAYEQVRAAEEQKHKVDHLQEELRYLEEVGFVDSVCYQLARW